MAWCWCVLSVLLLTVPAWGQAKRERVLTTDRPLVIHLEPHKPTAIALPEPIAYVALLERPDLYSVNWHGPYLYLYPLHPELEGQLFVVGQSGTQYPVFYKIARPADVEVRIAAPRPKTLPVPPVTLASWFRALHEGKTLPGQVPAEMPPPATRGDARLTVQRLSAVAHGDRVGLVLLLQNDSETPVLMDLPTFASAWGWPPRYDVALAPDPQAPPMLAPGASQRLYVVLERRP